MERKPSKSEKPKEGDLRPDGWERFERAIDAAVKVGPKHRLEEKKKRRRASDR